MSRFGHRWVVIFIIGLILGSALTYWFKRTSGGPWEMDPAVLTRPAPMDPSAPADTPRYALHEAAAKGLVEYEMRGINNSSGDSLLVVIRRLVDRDIDIYIIPGSVFRPASDKVQQMVAWGVAGAVVPNRPLQPVSSMYLSNYDVRGFILEAYCLNFSLENPSPKDNFQPVAAMAGSPVDQAIDVRAAQIIYEGKKRGLPIPGIQSAVWADHEHLTKQEIQTKFSASAKEMDDAFEMVKNMPPPRGR